MPIKGEPSHYPAGHAPLVFFLLMLGGPVVAMIVALVTGHGC
jgi:hypothetical protein